MFGLPKTYRIDYCGDKAFFTGAKDRCRAGKRVQLFCRMIDTDTDYSFRAEGVTPAVTYSDRTGYVLTFTMPAHDIRLWVETRSTMPAEHPFCGEA